MFTKDELLNMPKELKAEAKALLDFYFNNDVEENSSEEYLKNHASRRLITWYKESEEFAEENLKKGIIYN